MLTLLFGTEKKVFNRGGFHFSCKCLSCLCNVWQIDAVSGRRSVCVCVQKDRTHLGDTYHCSVVLISMTDKKVQQCLLWYSAATFLPPSGCHNASPSPSLCGSLSSSDVASSVHMFETAA